MKTLNLLKIALFLIVSVGFAACEKNYYSEIDNTTDKLCSNTWTNEYKEDNATYKHVLMFDKDGKGQEVVSETIYTDNTEKNYSTTYTISWRWIDNNREGLYISRVAGSSYEIHNVWIRSNYLSGDIEGQMYTFTK